MKNGRYALAFLAVFFGFFAYKYLSWRFNFLASEYNGTIEKIWYDSRITPYITVDGTEYQLKYDRTFQKSVEVGDVALKSSGDATVFINKKNGSKTVLQYKF
jgi:hypothetical protein